MWGLFKRRIKTSDELCSCYSTADEAFAALCAVNSSFSTVFGSNYVRELSDDEMHVLNQDFYKVANHILGISALDDVGYMAEIKVWETKSGTVCTSVFRRRPCAITTFIKTANALGGIYHSHQTGSTCTNVLIFDPHSLYNLPSKKAVLREKEAKELAKKLYLESRK